jgi:uncharacterized protein YsxB (DUF464 family)
MILDLTKLGISQAQSLALLDDIEQIEEAINGSLRQDKPRITSDERQRLIIQLRTVAAQLMNLANQINLHH